LLPKLAIGLALAVVQTGGVQTAEKAYSRAVELLAENDSAGAEAAARRALDVSSRFIPEQEIEVTPEKGLLFEEAIAQARAAYRERRSRYFRALGDALVRQERWAEAQKALHRAVALAPSADTLLLMGSQPGLALREKIRLMVDAYFAPGADKPRLEESLMETGAFLNEKVLQAVLDRKRFTLEVEPDFPDMEVLVAPLPEIRAVTSTGTLVSSDVFAEGMDLVLYFPVTGCNRCSEELDVARRAAAERSGSGRESVVASFVEESDLVTTRRIVRLLGMGIEVGRRDRLPAGVDPDPDGEIRIVTRRGFLQIRIPLGGRPTPGEIRRKVLAAQSLVPTAPDEEEEDESTAASRAAGKAPRAFSDLVEQAVALESGPVPIPDLYRQIDRALRRVLTGRSGDAELPGALEKLSRLRGAGSAKARALMALDRTLPDTLLAEVKQLESDIERQAPPQQGVFFVDMAEDGTHILLQRTFLESTFFRNFDFLLKLEDGRLSVAWLRPEPNAPTGVEATTSDAAFFFETGEEDEACRGLRLVGLQDEKLRYEGCPSHLEDGRIVEEKPALIDAVPGEVAPVFYRRGQVEEGKLVAPETSLERGLRLFRDGSYPEARSAFQSASDEIDPVAPYDAIDLRYNVARCYEAQGQLRKALELLRSIGDASYQTVVDERAAELEVASRR
jgi:tetratricopeptide (TPR) repeat protein